MPESVKDPFGELSSSTNNSFGFSSILELDKVASFRKILRSFGMAVKRKEVIIVRIGFSITRQVPRSRCIFSCQVKKEVFRIWRWVVKSLELSQVADNETLGKFSAVKSIDSLYGHWVPQMAHKFRGVIYALL